MIILRVLGDQWFSFYCSYFNRSQSNVVLTVESFLVRMGPWKQVRKLEKMMVNPETNLKSANKHVQVFSYNITTICGF